MANGVNDPVGGLTTATTAAQPAASWGTGGLGSYQLSDPSLAATPEWLKNRDPSLNRVDWGGNYDPVTGQLGVLPFFVGGSEAQDASYFQGGDTSNMAGYAGVLETGLPTYNISTEFGRPVDNYLKLNPASENPVRIINASQGKVTYEGAGDPQGLVSALDQATAEGNKNIWSVQAKVGDQWVTTHKNEPIGNLVRDYMLPAMLAVAGGAALGPLIGGTQGTLLGAGKLAAAAGTGLGSAAGSFTGNIAAGKPLDDALKAAAISGVTAGVLKGVLPGGAGAGDAAAGKAAAFAPGYDIAVAPAVPGLGGTTLALPAFSSPFTGVGAGLVTQALPAGTKVNEFGALVDSTTGTPTGSLGFSLDLPYIDDVLASMPNFGAAAPLASAASSVPGDVVVTGLRTGVSGLGNTIASAVPAVANIVGAQEVLGNQPVTPKEETTVTGKRIYDQAPTGPLAAIADAVAAAQLAPPTKDITVTQQRPQDAAPPPPITAVSDVVTKYAPSKPAESLIEKQAKKIDDADPITVTAEPIKATGSLGAALPGLAMTLPAMTAAQAISTTAATTPEKKGPGTIAKVTGGLAILDALSKLLGGKRGGTGGAGTGLESLAPTFRAQLPTPRGQFAPSALTQRDRSDIDYARYGYGPARSFFNYVPETAAERAAFATAAAPAPRVGVGSVFSTGAAPVGATTSVLSSSLDMLRAAMPGASDAEIEAFLNTPEGRQALTMIFEDMGAQPRAKGGKMGGDGRGRESFAVDGVGTGRSDEIPALLSDGEYVIDAETVAMLGDGSSRAGAKRLDDFRVKVRKHKGRNLAKGKFSANAKRPERYLSGGLV
jgi:hypothetical protein